MALSRLQKLWRLVFPSRPKKRTRDKGGESSLIISSNARDAIVQVPASAHDLQGVQEAPKPSDPPVATVQAGPRKPSIIESLPAELLFEIVGYLQPVVPSPGGDAAWKRPHSFSNWWSYKVPSAANQLPPREVQEQYLPRDLLALRIVSKKFYGVCLSFLYSDMNLVKLLSEIREEDHPIATKHGKHVRTLRIIVDHTTESLEEKPARQQLILDILKLCPNASTIAFYYGAYLEAQPDELAKQIFDAVDWTNIRSIGVYSLAALGYSWRSTSPSGSLAMLNELINPDRALSKQIKVLDVVMEFISMEVYNTIRSQFTSLSALTIRRSLRFPNCKIWDFGQQHIWRPNTNLTCLQLIDCLNVYSGHIPDLVRLFTSLRTLMISACGDYGDTPPLPRTKGWSKNDDALWRQRLPLDQLYIEHMADWEIVAMGEIPTRTLVAAGLAPKQLLEAFRTDPEIFPCMTTLRMEAAPPELQEGTLSLNPNQDGASMLTDASVIEAVCAERGVTVATDAHWLVFNQRQIIATQ
ncbi:hypothetical protein FRB91_000782 [Serendipita sp. 411]|nr:hypothetical protein FRB91_000782 [Serendipita sp. 411]